VSPAHQKAKERVFLKGQKHLFFEMEYFGKLIWRGGRAIMAETKRKAARQEAFFFDTPSIYSFIQQYQSSRGGMKINQSIRILKDLDIIYEINYIILFYTTSMYSATPFI
jgi:hypothetical protein